MIETLATGGVVTLLLGVSGYMMKRWSEKIDQRFDKLSQDMKEATKDMKQSFKETCGERQHACASNVKGEVDHLRSAVKYIHADRQAKWGKQQDINELIRVHIELNGRMRKDK